MGKNLYEIVYKDGRSQLVRELPHPAPKGAEIYRLVLDRDTLKLKRRKIHEGYK